MRIAPVLICLTGVCGAIAAAAPNPTTAREWLATVPPLPVTADAAYAELTDISGSLKPGPAFERVRNGIKTEIMTLARPVQATQSASGPVSTHDRTLAGEISVFPGTATVERNVQAVRTAQGALEQKWRADLNALEQHRLQERSALPACHDEAGAPSQTAIRDVEQAYAQQRITLAARYLAQFQPLVEQMLSAVAPRIEHGDSAMAAWTRLRNSASRAQLAPMAHGAESNALQDVVWVQTFIEDVSKLAARPVADRKALERVYAHAKGC